MPAIAQTQAPAKDGGAAAAPGWFSDFPRPAADLPSLAPVWPERWGRAGDKVRGVILDMDPQARLQGRRMAGIGFEKDVEALKRAGPEEHAATETFVAERSGGYEYFEVKPKEGDPPRRSVPAMTFRFVSGEVEQSTHGGLAESAVRIQRTWFDVFDPIAPEGEKTKPRGVALLMPGLFGTPEGTLSGLTTALRRDGWVVLRMLSQPSRFTERVEFDLNGGGDLAAQAKLIADSFGDRVAECAFAAQAACTHLEENRPELKELPRIAVGFSGGAMTLPTVVAREPERYSRAIMVGGGCDFWLMNLRSSYRQMVDAVHEQWDQPPTPEIQAKLDGLYLKCSPMDSYHTAAALKGNRVLMIQGTADTAVPSPLGDLLWERLGKPERWLVDGAGHELLFMTLPGKFGKIIEWINGVDGVNGK